MNFRNLTPFAAQCFQSLDARGQRHSTIVTRMAYRLLPKDRQCAELKLIEDEPAPLEMVDAYEGAINASSVRAESDLVPFKPRCDVLVRAEAFAPYAIETPRFPVRLTVEAIEPANPPVQQSHFAAEDDEDVWHHQPTWRPKPAYAAHELPRSTTTTVIDKTLIVCGPRHFEKSAWHMPAKMLSLGMAPSNAWTLGTPQPIVSLPLRYEYAYGGQCRIEAEDPAAERLEKSQRLTASQQASHPDAQLPNARAPLAHAVEPHNPVGRGFATHWYLHAKQAFTHPAPQIEYLDQAADPSATIDRFNRAITDNNQGQVLKVAGFGPQGRAWLPRLNLAGTYDDAWLEHQHPLPPKDFQDQYWNCAPSDQQIPFPNLKFQRHYQVRLLNLLPHDHPLCHRDQKGNTELHFTLPRHRAVLLTRWNKGLLLPYSLNLDTIQIDLITLQVHLVWRLRLPANAPIRIAELRFNTDPNSPLLPPVPRRNKAYV